MSSYPFQERYWMGLVLYETPPTLKLNEYSPFCSYLLTRSQFSADLKCFGCKKNELISSIQNKLIKICNITTINLRMKLYCSKVSTGDGWCPQKKRKIPQSIHFWSSAIKRPSMEIGSFIHHA